MGGSRSHLDKKKIGKLSKNKVLHLYNSPLLGGARGASRCACMLHFIPYSVIVNTAVRLTKWRISLVLCYLLLYMVVVILCPVYGLSTHVVSA